jgi:hypothetical protein
MKRNFTSHIVFKFFTVCLLFLSVSCSKTSTDDSSNTTITPSSDSALFLLVHASPSTANVDFRMLPKSLGGNLINVPYANATSLDGSFYVSRPAFNSNMSVYLSGTNTCTNKTDFVFGANKKYSIFIIDSLPNTQLATVEDILAPLPTDKAGIRFFNFGNKNTAMDIVFAGTTTKLFERRSFNDQASNPSYSAFSNIKSGNYTFEIRDVDPLQNVGTNRLTTTVNLQAGKFYTLYLRGNPKSSYANGTLGATLVNHN